jgi:glycosyltransferase involved in cell wall biosynthesis
MRVAVVTPVRDAAALVADTISSILHQTAVASGRVQVEYVVQDAMSTDDTAAIASRLLEAAPDGVTASVVSAQDEGLYDGLAKGFERVSGDWYCYLNAGDLWHPRTLDTLADVAEQTTAEWVCGLHAYYAANGTLVHTKLPYRYKQDLLRAGAYGRGLPTVQQESTYWNSRLHRTIDPPSLRSYRVAGDAYLWWTFAQSVEPAIVQALMGGFRYHGGHLGVSQDQYRAELERISGPLTNTARLQMPAQLALWEQPARVKARMNPNLYLHSTTTGGWVSQVGEITAT